MIRTAAWIFAVVSISLALAWQAGKFVRSPAKSVTKVLIVPPGSTAKSIARLLHKEGVLGDAWRMPLLARLTDAQDKLKPGEYRFRAPSSPKSALDVLVAGKVVLHPITIPEGFTVGDVGRVMAERGLMDTGTFERLTGSKELLEAWAVPGPTFEGYFFPDTYFFARTDAPETMLKTFVQHFHAALEPQDRRRAEKLGLSIRQWVALASMIEKESGRKDEHPIISSVFHNRLRKRMRLQSDPTAVYGLKDFDGRVTKRHLLKHTPYNTYTNHGIPPGPIANPGASALSAAVNPADTGYLFFVSKRDGSHAFSKTYKEHVGNIATYQIRRQTPP